MKSSDFIQVNFNVFVCDIEGGYFEKGGTSVIINLQNPNKLFIDGPGLKFEQEIKCFTDGLNVANQHIK